MSKSKTSADTSIAYTNTVGIKESDYFSNSTPKSGNQDSDYLNSFINNSGLSMHASMYEVSRKDNHIKKAIIILHGVMGSELYAKEKISDLDENTNLWINTSDILNQPNKNKALICNDDGTSKFKIKTAGIDDMEFQNNITSLKYGTLDWYTNITNKLKSIYAKEKNNSVHYYNYDWRLGVKSAVEALGSEFDSVIANHDITYFVAHSMGGLVACEYIKKYEDTSKLRLLTLATPYFGSPKALYIMGTGDAMDGFPEGAASSYMQSSMLEILPNIKATYDLLPTLSYTDISNYYKEIEKVEYKTVFEKSLCTRETNDSLKLKKYGINFNSNLYDKSIDFHNDLNVYNLFSNMTYSCAIVGYGEETVHEVIREHKKDYSVTYDIITGLVASKRTIETVKYTRKNKKDDDFDGDGTVPLISATMGGKLNKLDGRLYYVKSEHGAVASNLDVIGLVIAKIEEWDSPDKSYWGYNQSAMVKIPKTENEEIVKYKFQVVSTKFIGDFNDNNDFGIYLYDTYGVLMERFINVYAYIVENKELRNDTWASKYSLSITFKLNKNDNTDKYILELSNVRTYTLKINGKSFEMGNGIKTEHNVDDKIIIRIK